MLSPRLAQPGAVLAERGPGVGWCRYLDKLVMATTAAQCAEAPRSGRGHFFSAPELGRSIGSRLFVFQVLAEPSGQETKCERVTVLDAGMEPLE